MSPTSWTLTRAVVVGLAVAAAPSQAQQRGPESAQIEAPASSAPRSDPEAGTNPEAGPDSGRLPDGGLVHLFDVAPGPLDAALDRFARTAGVNLSYDPAIVARRSTSGLKGRHSTESGLRILLTGSGVEPFAQPGGGYQLRLVPRSTSSASAGGTLPAVTVNAQAASDRPLGYLSSRSQAGALGERPVLDTPFSISVVDSAEILERGARSLAQAFVHDVSVSSAGTPSYTTNWGATTIRGLAVYNFFIDGLPMVFDWGGEFPLEITENVTALKGLSGFMYGFGTPGGALSYQLKRPKPVDETTVYVGWRNPRLINLHADVSRRLTDDLAVRANLAMDRGTAYNDSRIERTVASLAIDKRFAGAVNWFTTLAYENSRNKREPFFFFFSGYEAAGGGDRLPRPVQRYADINVENAFYNTNTVMASTGLQWKIDDRWSLKYQLGASRKADQFNKMFAELTDSNGAYDGYVYQNATRNVSMFSQAMVQGTVTAGGIRNEIVAGLGARRLRSQTGLASYYSNDFSGNLHVAQDYLSPGSPDFSLGPANVETQKYAFVSDTLHIGQQWQVIAGLRYNHFESRSDGDATTPAYKTGKISPTLALIYKPDADTSLYGSYVDSLEPGTRVLPPYANAGSILGATVSRQYEIGAKHESGPMGYTAALFRVERANTMETRIGDDRFLTQDGRNIFQGAEVAAAYQVSPAFRIGTSLIHLGAKVAATDNAEILGKSPANTPKWQGALYAHYRVPGFDGLKLHGNLQYIGAAWAMPAQQLRVPSRTIFNGGFTYDFKVQGQNLTLIGNVYNLFNKKYWALVDTFGSRASMGEGRNASLAVMARF